MRQHLSRRCTTCATSWPLHDPDGRETDEFLTCPTCGQSTWGSSGEPTLSWDEAKRDKAYADFEHYLERREAADRELLERTEPFAFAQYLMDAAEEQIAREQPERAEPA